MSLPTLTKLSAWLDRDEYPISRATALRWCDAGDIPAKKLGADWYVMEPGQGTGRIPKRMKLEDWRQQRFTDDRSKPSKTTALKMCKRGDIPAELKKGQWYVLASEEVLSTGSDRVDAILNRTRNAA